MAKKRKEKEPITDDFDDEFDDEEYDDEDFEDDDDGFEASAQDSADDPYWWTPHLVLGLLLLTGLLGFFGLFNNALGFLAAKPHGEEKPAATATATAAATAAPKPPAPKRPLAKPRKRPAGPTFGARHLLVQYKGSMRAGAKITRTKEEAKKRADAAAKKAAAAAKANAGLKALTPKFSEIVGEFSDEPGAAKRGGDLGKFRKGSMTPKFQTAVEQLKVGEVSGVVETPFGYHVILRTL